MKPNEKAQKLAREIDDRLWVIKAKTKEKANKAKNWAHVGDLNHVLEMVEEIEQFLK